MLKAHEIIENDRHEALSIFAKTGLPNRKNESFHFTDLSRLAKRNFVPAIAAYGDLPEPLTQNPTARIVISNGRFRQDLSDINNLIENGVTIRSIADIIEEEPSILLPNIGKIIEMDNRPLLAENSGNFKDGLFLDIKESTKIDGIIEILYINEGADAKTYPRSFINIEKAAKATILEHHISDNNIWSNGVTELKIAANASLKHYRLQEEDEKATHTHLIAAEIAEDAIYDAFTLTSGAALSRTDLYSNLKGENIDLHLNGAYMIKDKQLCDTSSVIDHAVPHCKSRQTYRGVIDNRARGVFQGRINVWRDAQKTDGYQLNQALLLSDKAEIDSKPELEIFADDVICSHGATTGQLDEKALFYMQSRGIPKKEAHSILIGAFIKQSLDDVSNDTIKNIFEAKIDNWLKSQLEL